MKVVVGVVTVWCLVGIDAGLAPFIVPCHMSDSACLKTSAQKAVPVLSAGIPELGLKPIDPMTLQRVSASQAGLNMDFRNTLVKGLKNCIVVDLRRVARKMHFDVKCSVTLIGDYTLGGKLLILDIEGNGKYKIKIRDIEVKIVYDLSEVKRGNDKYWTISNWKHSSEVHTGAEFQFQNLFNGNKQLSDSIHQFANSNWREIFQEVSPPIVKAVVAGIVNETMKFFNKVPIKELTLDN